MNAQTALSLLTRLAQAPVLPTWWTALQPPLPVARRAPRQAAAVPDVQIDADAAAAGCGWFDSSHELHSGLLITEHTSAAVLPLAEWVDWHVRHETVH